MWVLIIKMFGLVPPLYRGHLRSVEDDLQDLKLPVFLFRGTFRLQTFIYRQCCQSSSEDGSSSTPPFECRVLNN